MSDTVKVVYQDSDMVVLNKPSGVAMYADRSGATSYWEQVKEYFQATPVFSVNRIDKGTSGLVVVAFSPAAQSELNRQFTNRQVLKYYLAICDGEISIDEGVVDLPLCPGRKSRYRVAGQREGIKLFSDEAVWRLRTKPGPKFNGKRVFPSRTDFKLIKAGKGRSLVLVMPKTGRTHQIRVHMAWIGHPLVGDHLYSKQEDRNTQRLALHSFAIGLTPPGQKELRLIKTDPPESFVQLIPFPEESVSPAYKDVLNRLYTMAVNSD